MAGSKQTDLRDTWFDSNFLVAHENSSKNDVPINSAYETEEFDKIIFVVAGLACYIN